METRSALGLLMALTLAMPSGLAAQDGPGFRRGPGPGMGICGGPVDGPRGGEWERGPRNPVRCILERQELELGEDQVSELQSLAEELDGRNGPLIEKLNELRPEPGQAGGRREEMMQRRREMEPLLREIRGNSVAAFGAALQVLTQEQRGAVERTMRPGRDSRGRREGPGVRGWGPGRGEAMMRRGARLMRRGQRMMMEGAMLMRRPPRLGRGGG